MSIINKNIISAFLIGVGIFLTWSWTLPVYQEAKLLKGIAKGKESELVLKEEILSRIESYYREYQSKEDSISRLSQVIPVVKSLPEVVTMLEAVSSANGVQIISFITNDQLGPSDSQHDLLTLEMDLSSTYPAFVNFLDSIEKNLRLFDANVVDISLSSTGQEGLLTIGLKLKGYVLKKNVKSEQKGANPGE